MEKMPSGLTLGRVKFGFLRFNLPADIQSTKKLSAPNPLAQPPYKGERRGRETWGVRWGGGRDKRKV